MINKEKLMQCGHGPRSCAKEAANLDAGADAIEVKSVAETAPLLGKKPRPPERTSHDEWWVFWISDCMSRVATARAETPEKAVENWNNYVAQLTGGAE